jgi:hypothetical protein
MRFVLFRKADPETEAGIFPPNVDELFAAMMKYNQEMIDAGVMVGGDGLMPSSRGAKIKFSGGRPTVIDGPFAEAKELVAGYTLIQVASRDEAIEWARKWPVLDGNGEVEIELRQIYEADDFGDALAPEIREQEERLRARMEA